MKVPLSWIKEFVDITLPLDQLASLLTMAGLEVDEVTLVGLPMPEMERHEFKFSGLSWEPDKIVVAQIDEVMPHPNADRLVLCRLKDGLQDHVVLTGAPNLYPYKGQGPLPKPIKVAYAKEGARIYDGHQPGQVPTVLKRAKIRGVESYSMVCSEKELGISEEHEGVIFLDDDAPTGMPLVDYMGDAVFEISILPNMIRNSSMLGIAREIAAMTGAKLSRPRPTLPTPGEHIYGKVSIEITDPELNPRFVLGLVRGCNPIPSPYWVQRRLRLAGMRPINSIVDATNYCMLEIGEPLHAFDYDVLLQRAGGKAPRIITRAALPGERLTTLDGVERNLDPFTVLVCDTAGALSLAGVMGGMESEVTETTHNVLLEGASWNFINTRRTVTSQHLNSEAAYRFARGVHPALAEDGVRMGLERLAQWSGGEIARGLVDEYPAPRKESVVHITPHDVKRLLGIELSPKEMVGILNRLEFTCRIIGETVEATCPPHRLDIGEGDTGLADLVEEIARIYGYNNIPYTRLSDALPEQRSNRAVEVENRVRDALVALGMQEVITYRLTSPEREKRFSMPDEGDKDYVRLLNPIAPDRNVMRRSLMPTLLEVLERNIRLRPRHAYFEVGPVFLSRSGQTLPDEPARLGLVMSGVQRLPAWDQPDTRPADFFDLKGVLEALFKALHIEGVSFEAGESPSLHPGKCAIIKKGEALLGVLGELHPLVKERYDFGAAPVLAADLDMEALRQAIPVLFDAAPVPAFPPVLEDIAVVVDEDLPAAKVEEVIRRAGGKALADVRLFDVFRSEQVGQGKKSMAYSLTYQSLERTLTDSDAAKVRQRVIQMLERELQAKLRS